MKHVERYNESFWDKFKKNVEGKPQKKVEEISDEDVFITEIDGVEFHEVEDYPSIPHEVWLTISPYVKRDCYHCSFLLRKVALYCTNDEAIQYRGTIFPGVFKCMFWQPEEEVIEKSKKDILEKDNEEI